MKIGFTERGDAGLDLRWFNAVKEKHCDGLIAITKNLTPACADKLMELHKSGFSIILHAGITGLSELEPKMELHTPDVDASLGRIQALIDRGFPKERIVLRIDPIILEEPYVNAPLLVLDHAAEMGLLPGLRVRISFMDNYPHVRERCIKAYGAPLYKGRWQGDPYLAIQLTQKFQTYIDKGLIDPPETCAEGQFLSKLPGQFAIVYDRCGCISPKDIKLMGLDVNQAPALTNMQQRTGCLCLACKCELLDKRHPCGNDCLYCYWKD